MTVVYVALGGALGSVLRYVTGGWVQGRFTGTFPVGTLAVNAIGSLLIGVAMAMFAARGGLGSRAQIAMTVGVFGGFTTYSAFAYETIWLLDRREIKSAIAYVVGTLLIAGIAVGVGFYLAKALAKNA